MTQTHQKIMLVDDNKANLSIAKSMLDSYYDVFALQSASKLFEFLKHITPDLILLDIEMPDMSGYDVIKILKVDQRYIDIPVIFLTARNEENDELEGLALGAVDYVTKPFSSAILLKRIESHLLIQKQRQELKELNDNLMKMVKDKTTQVIELQKSVISTVADLVEFRDQETGGHINRTQTYMQMIVNRLIKDNVYVDEMLAWENMEYLFLSAQLHDVGKLCISESILNKPGRLTPEEFEIMKTHAELGAKVIEKMQTKPGERAFLKYGQTIAGTHHEKWDGSGYPKGLSGRDIPLEGRIMAIADVYDALISQRPYKKPFGADESANIIIGGKGTHFDPELVEVFKKLSGNFADIARACNDKMTDCDITPNC